MTAKKVFTITEPSKTEVSTGPADFETAISATSFGKYNLFLILIAIPATWSPLFETTTMSYVFPAAQCDLDLSLNDKGILNAVTYLGMISSAVIWGFLYDTLGRKKLLMVGYFLDAIFVVMSAFSQDKILLMVSKFLGGFIVNGPFAALTSYISEFHCAKYRARMQLVLGVLFNFGSFSLPLLAWLVLPQNLYFSLANKSIEFHSWNIYLLICSLPSALGVVIFLLMPESPKFLMTVGRNKDALKVFQRVYSVNTGKPAETYPVKELVDEIALKKSRNEEHGGLVTANRSKSQALKEGWQQIKPLFFPPHLANIILVCSIQTVHMMNLNTLRLWLPQIFQAMNDYQYFNNDSSADLCTMLEMIQPSKSTEECVVNLNNSSVYINSVIVAFVSMMSYIVAGYLINIIGKKRLLNILGVICGATACSIYFAPNSATAVTLSSIFIACGSISTNVVLTVIIDLFPTTLRTMTISMAMMLGRCGAMSGNLVFPLLLQAGCAPPFFTVGSVITACAFLALLLPNTDLKALEQTRVAQLEKNLHFTNMSATEGADFETAMAAAGFGKYNIILLSLAIPTTWTLMFETTTIAYVFPLAQCDLDLSLNDKGLLNAANYLGMISSAMLWGFLYDTLGRRNLMILGYFLDAVFIIMGGFAQSKYFLMASTFLGGFIINGPSSAFMAFFGEFHGANHRAKMQLGLGAVLSAGNIVLPLIAWGILQRNIHFSLFDSMNFHAWNVFIFVCSLPALISAVSLLFIPESPKFLMTVGQNEKALEVFRRMYSVNTGKPPETYPIKKLVDEIALNEHKTRKHGGKITAKRTQIQALKEGWQQMKPLFFPPYIVNFLIICSVETIFMLSLNTLRLWFPQIFQAISDYQYFHNGTTADLCTMLEVIRPSNSSEECISNTENTLVYTNSIIGAVVCTILHIFVGYFINKFGKKKLLNTLATLAGLSACSIYFAPDSLTVTVLSTIFAAAGNTALTVMTTINIDLFPTSLRTFTISIDFMLGRCGAMLGNLVFPLLLRAGCAPPFFVIGSLIIGCMLLACLLPNTDLKPLE